MNILVAGVQVPFTRGGAEFLIEGLLGALRSEGHLAELVQMPFSADPKERIIDSMVQWRGMVLDRFAGKSVDLVIGTKFPAYLLPHAHKAIWLIHQHRQAYELYGTRFGDFDPSEKDEALRQMIYLADKQSFQEAKAVFTISQTVSERLKEFCGVESTPLLPPPPLAGRFRNGKRGDYILSVGRLCSIKRPDLLIRALPFIDSSLHVKIVGTPDQAGFEEHLQEEIRKHRVTERVHFLGKVGDEELLSLYSDCFGVYYAPHDEDYGFVTLEGLCSGKAVVTASDSGGVLSFVKDGVNGFVAPPTPEGIAAAFGRLLDEETYSRIAATAAQSIAFASWKEIVQALTSVGKKG